MCACSTNEEPVNADNTIEGTQTLTFHAVCDDTRTHFGDKNGDAYPTLWDEDDKISACVNHMGGTHVSTATTLLDGGKSAEFQVNVTINAPSANQSGYTYFAYTPQSDNSSGTHTGGVYNASSTQIRYWIPETQTPTATSVDRNAQLLFGKSETYSETTLKPAIKFAHLTAYGKLTLLNLTPDEGDKVKSVTLTAANKLTAGYIHKPQTLTTEVGGTALNTLTINVTDDTADLSALWFACFAGVDGTNDISGTTLTVQVITENLATYTKEIDLTGKTLKFEAGKVSAFKVDMADAVVAKPEVGKKLEIYVDFGGVASESPWNNYNAPKTGTVVDLTDADGMPTNVSITTTANFSQAWGGAGGETYDLTSKEILFPVNVWKDALIIKGTVNQGNSKASEVTLSGLDNTKKYTLTLLAVRYNSSIGARTSIFTVTGATASDSQEVAMNIKISSNTGDATAYHSWDEVPFDSLTARFASVTPAEDGTIKISVVGKDTTTAADGFLNAIHLIEVE